MYVVHARLGQRRIAHLEAWLHCGGRRNLAVEQSVDLARAIRGCALQHGREFVLRGLLASGCKRLSGGSGAAHLFEEVVAVSRRMECLLHAE